MFWRYINQYYIKKTLESFENLECDIMKQIKKDNKIIIFRSLILIKIKIISIMQI